uniref:Uncharacterized protein n=1 Tax=Glossina palpalis gambiensis TaxID=67801 RepID=A0A1B0C0X9_9MUSC
MSYSSRVKYRGGMKNFRKLALNSYQVAHRSLLLRLHVKARSLRITTMVAGKWSLSTLYASASSSICSVKSSGSLWSVKSSPHLLTTSMTAFVSTAVGKTLCALPIGFG